MRGGSLTSAIRMVEEYLIKIALAALPLFYMELSLGQFSLLRKAWPSVPWSWLWDAVCNTVGISLLQCYHSLGIILHICQSYPHFTLGRLWQLVQYRGLLHVWDVPQQHNLLEQNLHPHQPLLPD